MINLLTIQTRYPHWGQYSGIQQYLRFLDKSSYNIDERFTNMGEEDFPVKNHYIREKIKRYIKKHNLKAYELNDLAQEISIVRQLFSKDVDIIQFFDGEHGLLFFAYWAKKILRSKKKIIGMYHQPLNILKDIVSTDYLQYLDHVVIMSEEQRPFFNKYIDDDKISVIFHGIDTDYFTPSESYKKKDQTIRCITVGKWLRDYKVIDELSKRFVGEDIEFHIVADYQYETRDNIKVHKAIPDSLLLELYQTSDILLMPLQNATANNALLEGMACGLSIISSDLQAVREYTQNSGAVLIKNNDVNTFEDEIRKLMNDTDKRDKLRLSSRARALELSWRNIAKSYDALYKNLEGQK